MDVSNRFKRFLAIFGLLLPLSVFGQDFDKDIAAIVAQVNAAESFTVETAVKIYDRKGGKMQEQLKASVMGQGKSTYTVIAEIEILATANEIIFVDRDEKLIEVEHKTKLKPGKATGKESLKLDELLKLSDRGTGLVFKLTNTSGNVRTYTASNPKMGMRSVQVKLDAAAKKLISYAVEQVDENGKALQYVLIDYTRFVYSADAPELLKITHFITHTSNGAYEAASAYKGYKVTKK